jgi:hypothetical protein
MKTASSLFIVKLVEIANPLKQVDTRMHFLSYIEQQEEEGSNNTK